jgi:hypothetical protein
MKPCVPAFATLAMFAVALVAPLSAQTVRTVVSNGPPTELYDMVFLGDGYQAHEEALFDQDVLDVVSYFRNTGAKFPYGAYFALYNVHTVFRASNQSGADKPPLNVFVDTAYDASYWTGGTERCLYIGNTARATQDAALAPDTDGRVIVLVNDAKYGGCAGTFSVSYNGTSMEDVQAHEWGHSFGGLADEYDYGNTGPYTGGEPGAINCTADATGNAKWPQWVGFNGQYGTVGGYPGACYYPPTPTPTLYRPEQDCEMRNLNRRFCTICREQMIKRFHRDADPIGNLTPTPGTIAMAPGPLVAFSFTNRIPQRPRTIEWRVAGVLQAQNTTSFALDTSALRGLVEVRLRFVDTSPEVRFDPTGLLVHEKVWNLDLSSCGGATTVRYYGTGCHGAFPSVPLIYAQGTPRIPGSVGVGLSTIYPNRPAALLIGGSDQLFGGAVPLPLDLLPFGFTGCRLWQSADLALPLATAPNGSVLVSFPIPFDPSMDGGALFFQWLVLDPPANAGGAVFSAALQLTMCF